MTTSDRPSPARPELARPSLDRPLFTNRLMFGLVFIALGVLWTLDYRGVLDASKILVWWPAAAVAWGLVLLFGIGVPRCRTLGGIWLALGTICGLDALHVWRFSAFDLLPLFLVFVGVLLVTRAWRGTRLDAGGPGSAGGPGGPGSPPSEGAHANFFTILSGAERRVSAQEFQGGEATAILGGLTLDLRGARLAQGRAVLDLFAMWGGIEIIAPPGWRVVSRVSPLLGAYVDSMPPVADAGAPTLELRGYAVMGGVDVRSDDRMRNKVRRAIVGAHFAPEIQIGVVAARSRRPPDDAPAATDASTDAAQAPETED
jgi:hypothetical protein